MCECLCDNTGTSSCSGDMSKRRKRGRRSDNWIIICVNQPTFLWLDYFLWLSGCGEASRPRQAADGWWVLTELGRCPLRSSVGAKSLPIKLFANFQFLWTLINKTCIQTQNTGLLFFHNNFYDSKGHLLLFVLFVWFRAGFLNTCCTILK